MRKVRLIVGLGNPGAKYAQTRHNVGWLVLDELARCHSGAWRKSGEAEVLELRLGRAAGEAGEKVLLAKPQTFMNTSGRAVAPLMRYYRLTPAQLLVVQDDLDSPFGLLKLKRGGRHGGQNGLRDIIRLLGTQDFARLKIGISRPPPGRDPADWVLSNWAADERSTLQELVRLGAGAAATWALAGLEAAQGEYNSTDLRPQLSSSDVAQPAATRQAGAQAATAAPTPAATSSDFAHIKKL